MADYYTNFSVVLPLTKEQQAYASEIAKQVEEHHAQELPADFPSSLNDEIENWTFETEITEKGLWLHSQCGGQDAACVFIQHLLQKFGFAEGVTFEWSHDCSKPRTDAYLPLIDFKHQTTACYRQLHSRSHQPNQRRPALRDVKVVVWIIAKDIEEGRSFF